MTDLALLTDRQEQILDFIEDRMEQDRCPPTRQEIADKFGLGSANAANDHLRAMAKKGRIELVPRIARGIRLVTP